MEKHICKNCGQIYNYCRVCRISPIPYNEAGFCSAQCSNEFKNKQKEVVQKDVEVVVNNKDATIS